MIKVLSTISETFPNIEEILNGTALVVTKVPYGIIKEKIIYNI
jgi:hypothetical protein